MPRSDGVAARAQALIGTRFRPQGRGRDGLDCIGLVAAALGLSEARRDYALRGGDLAALEAGLAEAGLRPVGAKAAGDVVVLRFGPGQLHLGVWTGEGLVHADAGLGQVVERPGAPPWPIVSIWRKE